MLQNTQLISDGVPYGRAMHYLPLNAPQSQRPKVRALCSLIQSFSFPDIISLQKMGGLPGSLCVCIFFQPYER